MAKDRLERPVSGALTVAGTARIEDADPASEHDPGGLPDEAVQPDNVVLEEVLAQLGEEQGQARCMVWRVPSDARGDEEFLYELTALDFARRGGVNDLAKRYGAGIYRIRVYRGGKIYTHKRLKIGAPIMQDFPAANNEVAALRTEVNTAITGLSAAFQSSIEKLVAAQPKPLTLREQLGDLVALKDFLGGGGAKPASALSQLKDMAELMQTVKGLIPAGAGEPGLGNTLMRLGEKFLPEILTTIKAAAPGGVPALGQPAVDGEGDMKAMRELQLKMALDFLIDSAARKLPAETYADLAVDKVPTEDLVRLLNQGDWFGELNRLEPRVADHQEWFTKLREEILAILRENGVLTDAPASTTMEGGTKPPPSNVS